MRKDSSLIWETPVPLTAAIAVHYLFWDIWRDAQTGAVVKEEGPLRITYTCQRRGDSWQIITGMSASYDY
jgi:hypothetical protein